MNNIQLMQDIVIHLLINIIKNWIQKKRSDFVGTLFLFWAYEGLYPRVFNMPCKSCCTFWTDFKLYLIFRISKIIIFQYCFHFNFQGVFVLFLFSIAKKETKSLDFINSSLKHIKSATRFITLPLVQLQLIYNIINTRLILFFLLRF